ncbi:MAG: hypothetical protein EOM26_10570 [Alphaproteobacteria bacterium]|nr:hypothetical protein [Alphaproteobacteria bacterium]
MVPFNVRNVIARSRVLLGGAALCASFILAGPSNAQEAACDSEIMDAIHAKAYLEAHVENVMNQALMTKPDSVFEYSCFDYYVIQAALYVGPSASETQVFGPVPRHDPESLDRALQGAIMEALAEYLFSNFAHSFLGGRAIPSDIDSRLTTDCSTMRAVWWRAKCANFLAADTDGFFSYDQHSDLEVRYFPSPCNNPPEWDSLIDLAIEDPPWWDEYALETSLMYEAVYDRLSPDSCAAPTSRSHVMVQNYPDGEFPDAICTNPGCKYNGSQCVPVD